MVFISAVVVCSSGVVVVLAVIVVVVFCVSFGFGGDKIGQTKRFGTKKGGHIFTQLLHDITLLQNKIRVAPLE